MEIVWNRYRNEQSYSNYRTDGDYFEQYVERMRTFLIPHDFLEYTEHMKALYLAHASTEPVEAKARRGLLRLLNLIPIYGIAVLPRNSQN